jgi:RNA polymerase sigma factor (TIGR02999 family)
MAKFGLEPAHLVLESSRGSRTPGHEITHLLHRWRGGHRAALDELFPLVYSELKRIAAACLNRERPGATLQVTALVHETYLRLSDYRRTDVENRKHFYVVAAQAMRRILVDHARRRNALKRMPALRRESGVGLQPDTDVLALEDALNRLAANDPEKARIVELRYFAGLSVEEVAEIIGASSATVKRHWAITKAWLYRALTREAAG